MIPVRERQEGQREEKMLATLLGLKIRGWGLEPKDVGSLWELKRPGNRFSSKDPALPTP